jgi:hypothetical protein
MAEIEDLCLSSVGEAAAVLRDVTLGGLFIHTFVLVAEDCGGMGVPQ